MINFYIGMARTYISEARRVSSRKKNKNIDFAIKCLEDAIKELTLAIEALKNAQV